MKNDLLIEGISDAIGFVGGALQGFWAGRLLGLDVFAPGYCYASIAGIVLVGVAGGIGLRLARRWRTSRKQPKE